MYTIETRGSWEEQKIILNQKFAKLTEDNLLYMESKKDLLLNKLEINLGKSKEDLIKIIDNL